MPHNHIVSVFDDELNNLRAKIVKMSDLVIKQYQDAFLSFQNNDLDFAEKIKKNDKNVDKMDLEIEQYAIKMIALRSPVADDLREIVSAIKISAGLERIGDYAKNLAKRVKILSQTENISVSNALLEQMVKQIINMTADVIDAYINHDVNKAIEVWRHDQQVDSLYNSLFREMLTYMMENPQNITNATHLLFIAKNIERAGDHATNIAELVYYINEGELLSLKRPKNGSSNYAEVNQVDPASQ